MHPGGLLQAWALLMAILAVVITPVVAEGSCSGVTDCIGTTPICSPGFYYGHYCYGCTSDGECTSKVAGSIGCSDDGSCLFAPPTAPPTALPTRPTPNPTAAPTYSSVTFTTSAALGFFTVHQYMYYYPSSGGNSSYPYYYNTTQYPISNKTVAERGLSSNCAASSAYSSISYPTAKCILWSDSSYPSIQSIQAIWNDGGNNKLVIESYSTRGCSNVVSRQTYYDLGSSSLGSCINGAVKYEFKAGTTLPDSLADASASSYYSGDSTCSSSPYKFVYYYSSYTTFGKCSSYSDSYTGSKYSYKMECDSAGLTTYTSFSGSLNCSSNTAAYSYSYGQQCDSTWTSELPSGAYVVNFCLTKGSAPGSLAAASPDPTPSPTALPTLKPSNRPTPRPTFAPTRRPTSFQISGASEAGWVAVRQCSGTTLLTLSAYAIGQCIKLSSYDAGLAAGLANSMTYQFIPGLSSTDNARISAVYFFSSDCTSGNISDRVDSILLSFAPTAKEKTSCAGITGSASLISPLANTEADVTDDANIGIGTAWYSPTDTFCQNPAVVVYDVFSCVQSTVTKQSGGKVTATTTSTSRVCATSSLYVQTTYSGISCKVTASDAKAQSLSDSCASGASNDFPQLGLTRKYCGAKLAPNSPTLAPTLSPTRDPTPAPFSRVPTLAPVKRTNPVVPPSPAPTAAVYTVSISFKLPGLDYSKDVTQTGALSKVLKAVATSALQKSGIDTSKVVISDLSFSTNSPSARPTARPTNAAAADARREMLQLPSAERERRLAGDSTSAKRNYLEVKLTLTGSFAQMTAAANGGTSNPASALQAVLQQNLESSFKDVALQEAAKQGMLTSATDAGTIARIYQVYAVVANQNFITSTMSVSQNQPTLSPLPAAPRPTLPPSKVYTTVIVDNNLKDDAVAGIIIGMFFFVIGAVGGVTFLYIRKETKARNVAEKEHKPVQAVSIKDVLPTNEAIATSILKFFPQNNSVEVNDLSNRGLALPVTLLYIAAFLGCLVYFTTITTSSLAGNQFLSLDGTNSEQICKNVPNTITAKYAGDVNGAWSTNPNYLLNSSVYVLDLQGTSIDDDIYRTVLSTFDTKLYALGKKVAERDVAFGILTWTTFGLQDESSRMSLYSNMAANLILEGASPWGVVWSREGQCKTPGDAGTGTASMENNGKILRLQYTNVTSNPCPSAFNPLDDFQFNGRGSNNLNIDIDTRSVMTAVAVNLGIIDTSNLIVVQKEVDVSSSYGLYYVDPFYEKMTPIFCVQKENALFPELASGNGGNDVCFVVYKNLAMYPAMWSVQNLKSGEKNILRHFLELCTCPSAASSVACQTLNIQITLIYWRSSTSKSDSSMLNAYKFGVQMKRRFLDPDPVDGDLALNRFLFSSLPNQWYQRESINGSDIPSIIDPARDPQVLFDSLCPDQGCAAFQFFVSLPLQDFMSVNPASVQYGILSNTKYYHAADDDGPNGFSLIVNGNPQRYIPKLSCENVFYNAKAIKRFTEKPPTTLVQLFSACHMTQRAALISAIGSSSGSATLYSQVIFSIIIAIILSVVNKSAHSEEEKILSPAEKAQRKKDEEERQMLLICEMVAELVKAEVDKIHSDKEQTKKVSNKFHELYRKKRAEAEEAERERRERKQSLFGGSAEEGDGGEGEEGESEGGGDGGLELSILDMEAEQAAEAAAITSCVVCVGAAVAGHVSGKKDEEHNIHDHESWDEHGFVMNEGQQRPRQDLTFE